MTGDIEDLPLKVERFKRQAGEFGEESSSCRDISQLVPTLWATARSWGVLDVTNFPICIRTTRPAALTPVSYFVSGIPSKKAPTSLPGRRITPCPGNVKAMLYKSLLTNAI